MCNTQRLLQTSTLKNTVLYCTVQHAFSFHRQCWTILEYLLDYYLRLASCVLYTTQTNSKLPTVVRSIIVNTLSFLEVKVVLVVLYYSLTLHIYVVYVGVVSGDVFE